MPLLVAPPAEHRPNTCSSEWVIEARASICALELACLQLLQVPRQVFQDSNHSTLVTLNCCNGGDIFYLDLHNFVRFVHI